jgi:hypothetical protein
MSAKRHTFNKLSLLVILLFFCYYIAFVPNDTILKFLSEINSVLRVKFMVFNTTFNNISAIVEVSVIGGGNRSTRRQLATCRKSLTNFIT